MMDKIAAIERCSFNEKGEIKPCYGLSQTLDPQKGMDIVYICDIKTGDHLGSSVNLRMGSFRKGGVNINFCPACGSEIGHEARRAIIYKDKTPQEIFEDAGMKPMGDK